MQWVRFSRRNWAGRAVKIDIFDSLMDELKIIIWIIIGLVYLFARRKKPVEPRAEERREVTGESQDIPESTQPMSFEELLQEIQGMKKEQVQPLPALPVDRPPVKRDWEYSGPPEGKEPVEDTQYDYREHDKIYDVYEDARKQAFLRPSLEETSKLGDTIVRFKQFKEYAAENKRNLAEEFFKELKEPQGFKKAFIMSEILKKRF